MGEQGTVQRLRFMELVQRCLPSRWRRYWDCGARYFDLLMMLQDTENPRLRRKERILLGLLARIGGSGAEPPWQLLEATRGLDRERQRIVRQWLKAGEREYLPLVANPKPLPPVNPTEP